MFGVFVCKECSLHLQPKVVVAGQKGKWKKHDKKFNACWFDVNMVEVLLEKGEKEREQN